MNLVAKALWYIESHSEAPLTLDDIAAACGVSRFHLARVFGVATGFTVMRYLRARRLSVAARALADGAPGILNVALDAGYGSHEAFTRAFRDQFGMTPETVRLRGNVDNLELMEPIRMTENQSVKLEEPRRETGAALLIVGLLERYSFDAFAGIPMQWQRFGPYIDTIPARAGREAFGVCCDFDDTGHYDYVCGVAVSRLGELDRALSVVRIPARDYLVFRHEGHISGIPKTWHAIMNDFLPASACRPADAPSFERYAADFDAESGLGGAEIWIPLAA